MPFAVSAVCGALVVGPLLVQAGFPAYQHDWSWPTSRDDVTLGFLGHLSVWQSAGLGKPNPLASANPLLVLFAALGWIFGGVLSGKIALLAPMVIAAAAATYCAQRTVAVHPVGALLAGGSYVSSPVIFNKIAAGHVTFWWAYALLPLIFERTRAAAGGNRSAPLTIALLCALATLQPQFAVFSLLAVAAAALPFSNPKAGLGALAAAAGGTVIGLLPTGWALLAAQRDLLAQFPRPVAEWEAMHSASFATALLAHHYIIPYYERAFGGSVFFAQCAAAAGLLGLLICLRNRNGAALAFLLVAGLTFTTGTLGPAGSLWRWVFDHFEFAAFFRELYNASVLVAFAYALGAAAAFRGPLVLRVVVAALVVAAASPMLLGKIRFAVHNVVNDDPSFSAAIAQRPQGRILPLPLLTPAARNGSEPGGIDGFAPRDERHPTLSEYPMQFPLMTVALTGTFRDRWWTGLIEKAAVVAAVTRPDVRSDGAVTNSLGTAAAGTAMFVPINGRPLVEFVKRTTSQALSYKQMDPESTALSSALGPLPERGSDTRVITPQASLVTDDPRMGWVPLDRWRAVAPDPASSLSDGVVTSSSQPITMTLPPGEWWLLAQSQGVLMLQEGERVRALRLPSAQWIALGKRGGTIRILSRGSRAAVFRVARGMSALPVAQAMPSIDAFARATPWSVSVRLRGPTRGTALLIFRDRFSPAWEIRGARTLWHGIADGYANAFLIAPAGAGITIFYAPERVFLLLSSLTWLAYAAAIAKVFQMRAQARRR